MYRHAGWMVTIPKDDGTEDILDRLFLRKTEADEALKTLHAQGLTTTKVVHLYYYEMPKNVETTELPETTPTAE